MGQLQGTSRGPQNEGGKLESSGLVALGIDVTLLQLAQAVDSGPRQEGLGQQHASCMCEPLCLSPQPGMVCELLEGAGWR